MQMSKASPTNYPAVQNHLWSVRSILICSLITCFLPCAVGVVGLFYREYRDGRAQLERDAILTSRALIQTVDGHLAKSLLAARILAASESLARRDFAGFHLQASALLANGDLGLNVALSEETGRQIVNTLRPFGEPLPQKASLDQIHRVFATGKPVISDLFTGPLTGRPTLSVVVPVVFDGKVSYALSIVTAPQHLNNILTAQHSPDGWVLGILDSKGINVARNQSPELIGRQVVPEFLKHLRDSPEGAPEITTLDGIPIVAAYSQSALSGWTAVIGIPRNSLEAPLIQTLARLSVGAVAFFGLSLALAWFVGRKISLSAKALQNGVYALQAGTTLLIPPLPIKEAAEIANALELAAQQLADQKASLTATNKALVFREAELAEAQRIAKIGRWTWIATTDETFSSEELYRIFGRDVIPPFSEQSDVLYPREVWLQLNDAVQNVIKTGIGFNLELPALGGDGSSIWVNTRSELLRNSDGEIIGLHGIVQDITERKQAESIATNERFIRTITDTLPSLIAYWDKDLRCHFANKAYLEWFGKAPEAILGRTIMELLGEQLFARNEIYIRGALAGATQHFERTLTKADGSFGYTLAHYVPDIDAHGQVVGFFVMVNDVTPIKEAEAELELASNVYQNTIEAIMVTDSRGIILSVNPAFTDITGYTAQEAIGQTPRILRSHHYEQEFHAAVWRQIADKGQWRGEIWNRRKNGEIFLEWQTITKIPGSGDSSRYVSVFHDITDSWNKNEKIRHLAFHDALTNLPNRTLLLERLNRHIVQTERNPRKLALLFLDLDRFKLVNDTFGHEIGDELLIAVAQKLQALVRQSDTVARLGGDEFVIALDNPANQDVVSSIAERVIDIINEPMIFQGNLTHVGTSIGIALYPDDADTSSALLKSADAAMYSAKTAGKNTYRFFG